MKARLPQGMGKGPSSQKDMLRQVQKMQQDMEAMQEELENREYDIAAGGGVCKIKITGKKEIKSIELDPMIVDPEDLETLQDILVAGVNEAIKRVEEASASEMSKITGNLSIPGLF
jgi:DNA-binding YbaB/EbfC family protein